MAYQIAFDMYESATQQFLARVLGEHSNLREKYRLEWKYRLWPGLERGEWRVGQENVTYCSRRLFLCCLRGRGVPVGFYLYTGTYAVLN
jgi:hypothetical protein